MAKPPPSTPHSDLDGVRQDQESNIDTANDAGQDSGDLGRAADENAGRPPHSNQDSRDDRTS